MPLFTLSRHTAQRGVTTQLHRDGHGGQIKCVIMVLRPYFHPEGKAQDDDDDDDDGTRWKRCACQ